MFVSLKGFVAECSAYKQLIMCGEEKQRAFVDPAEHFGSDLFASVQSISVMCDCSVASVDVCEWCCRAIRGLNDNKPVSACPVS